MEIRTQAGITTQTSNRTFQESTAVWRNVWKKKHPVPGGRHKVIFRCPIHGDIDTEVGIGQITFDFGDIEKKTFCLACVRDLLSQHISEIKEVIDGEAKLDG